jgi:YD repeat-containing protein
MERADNSVVQYNYDENGNMTLYRTAYPADNSFDYNGVNNRSSFVTPLGSTTSYSYNEERQLTRVTLPSTKAIVNSYVSGQLQETATPEWTNIYEYHCGDLVGSITRGAEKVDYSYDGDLLTAIAQSGTVTGSLGFSYNNDFQLASFTYAGATAELGYDKDGLLLSSGGFTIGRNSDNGLPETVFANSFSLSRTFNDHGEVDGVGIDVGGAVFSYDLTRDTTCSTTIIIPGQRQLR